MTKQIELTAEQISKVARTMSDREADTCGINRDDNWENYSLTYIDDIKVVLEALGRAEAQANRDREADRHKFPDDRFNRWLDEIISDAGHIVWDQITDIGSAWHGWDAAKAEAHQGKCEYCGKTDPGCSTEFQGEAGCALYTTPQPQVEYREALAYLVDQIRKTNPVDECGHDLGMNMAYIAAVELIAAPQQPQGEAEDPMARWLPTGISRAEFHNAAWVLYSEKAQSDKLLGKLSIHTVRNLWNAIYDSMIAQHVIAAPQQPEPSAELSDAEIDAIDDATWTPDRKTWSPKEFARAIIAALEAKRGAK